MHKLILSFKGKLLKVFIPDKEQCRIGSHIDCEIHIDNLAVSSVHAILEFKGKAVKLRQLSSDSPVWINDQLVQARRADIQRGDEIRVGKHHLTYQWEVDAPTKPERIETRSGPVCNGWLQMLNGPKMGRMMHLNKDRLHIGPQKHLGAMIVNRQDGYFLSPLDASLPVLIDQKPIGDTTVNLQDGNTIRIGDAEMLFFLQETTTG